MKILITGGSSGLGKSVLEKLQDSNEIHFTYNNSKNEAKELTKRFKNTYSYKCDFTVEKELEEFISKIEKIEFDILINNYYSGKFLDKHFIKSNSSLFKSFKIPVVTATFAFFGFLPVAKAFG